MLLIHYGWKEIGPIAVLILTAIRGQLFYGVLQIKILLAVEQVRPKGLMILKFKRLEEQQRLQQLLGQMVTFR